MASIDPIDARGPRFYFEVRPDDEMWISLLVPDCGDKVDLAVALQIAKLDAKACKLTLERDNSLQASLRVYLNTLQWLKFLSVRHPNDECRIEYQQQLLERMAGLEALKLKAGMHYRLDVLEELKAV